MGEWKITWEQDLTAAPAAVSACAPVYPRQTRTGTPAALSVSFQEKIQRLSNNVGFFAYTGNGAAFEFYD
ncbi:hypothetical protein ACFLU6_15530 [Acidobacteriota bacterium]